ncbi:MULTISPECIES: branched-chain amino acid ABC transporter permease [unclassified Bradyrhizobium]|uniref:branched-chain amino acid ABC transporter permease n=1 Tax=Bradyrhizobium sp. USDA 4541 TaxID=2817704 RepID=UPI0020A455D2|nr:branched-chain amino acid ABC transporter permease [Bradyrhizobium sp. USDA 4541]MCP1848141.1 branched-chain amino acid transport system permease protein [Bradyrhizobium sp. USDA 4541]
MEFFLQQIINALALGGTYALIAIGLAMIFSVMNLINFAHGELMTIGGYVLFFLLAMGMPFGAAVLLSLAAAALAAVVMELVAFRPFRNADIVTMLLTSFAVSSILHVLFQNIIGVRPKAIAIPQGLSGAWTIGAFNVGIVPLIAILASLVSVVALVAFLRTTHIGVAMRAAAQDFRTTQLMGVNANAVILIAFAISGLFAGVAGALWIFQRGNVDPIMGVLPLLKAFIAVVVGGLGSLPGAAVGGLLLGGLEVFLRAYLPDWLLPFRDAISLSLIIGVFTFYPHGLFGKADAVR